MDELQGSQGHSVLGANVFITGENQAGDTSVGLWVDFHRGFSSLVSGVISEAIVNTGAAINHLCRPGSQRYRLTLMWFQLRLQFR